MNAFHDMFEQSAEAVLLIDPHDDAWTIVDSNTSAQKLFGYAPREMLGRSLSLIWPHITGEVNRAFYLENLQRTRSIVTAARTITSGGSILSMLCFANLPTI